MMLNTYTKAASLGMIAGMRSMSAPALVSSYLERTQPASIAQSPLRWLGTPIAAALLRILALGEVGADKLPNIPARIEPGPLAARAVSGSLAGAAICIAEDKQAVAGAITGGLAAIASSYAFYYLRRAITQSGKVPDPIIAAAEDALVLSIGRSVLKSQGGPA